MLIVALIIVAVALYYWLMRPRLRRLPRWDAAVAKVRALFERACVRLRGLCGNSKTIAVAYAAELLGVLDEAKVLSASRRRQRRPRHGDHGRGDDPAAPRHPHRGRLQGTAVIKRASSARTVLQEQASDVFNLVLSAPRGVPARRRARWPAAPI